MSAIHEILKGIDQQDNVECGWWETSTDAEFGAKKLAEVDEYVDALKAQVEYLKEANETWRIQWAATEFDNIKIKAQVNCLRDVIEDNDRCILNWQPFNDALEATPEQCLNEVKAKVIECVFEQVKLIQRNSFLALHKHPSVTKVPETFGRWIDRNEVDDVFYKQIDLLREQAK